MVCRCRLKHLVDLQEPTNVTTPDGTTETWQSYAVKVRAGIEPLPLAQTQAQVSGTLVTPVSHIVTMRYRHDVSAADRVVHETRVLYILRIRHLDKRQEMDGKHWTQLACEERAA